MNSLCSDARTIFVVPKGWFCCCAEGITDIC